MVEKETKKVKVKKILKRKEKASSKEIQQKKISSNLKKVARGRGIYIVLSFVAIFLLVGLSLVKFIQTKDFSSCIIEMILLVVFTFILTVLFLSTGKTKLPKTILGIKIERRFSKKKRNFAYALDSFFISLSITTVFFVLVATDKIFIDFYGILHGNLILSVILVEIISFLLLFLLFFIIDYFHGEKKLKREKVKEEAEV